MRITPPVALEVFAEDAAGTACSGEVFLQHLRCVVLHHLDDPDLHVNDLCRALFMSHSQLYRKLTALTGMSPNQFICNVRLQEAATLLRDPKRSVSDVAFDTGFRDPDYFGRAFRKHFGMTPTEYRIS